MGRDISTTAYNNEHRQRYRQKVRQCLDVFEQMLTSTRFAFGDRMTGMEIELNLVDRNYQPKMNNADILAAIADPEYQTELAQFNIEFNVAPRKLAGDALATMESQLRLSLNAAERKCVERDTHIMLIGILPTVMPETFEGEWMSDNARYEALNNAMLAARGEDIHINIRGPRGEHLNGYADSLAPESACTSVQLHLQVHPLAFANHWNAAQVLAGPQLALGANSPYFMGHDLWAETRIQLFKQATDTRPVELKNQGVRPRVYFGERWITSIFDLFEENVHYYPALLPEIFDEDPQEVMDAGGVPQLSELMLHNGTIYRWNRPIYDTVDGTPHVRVENRVLPAGPTNADTLANAAFYYGTLHALALDDRPVWSRMSFKTAEKNFISGSKQGIDAELFWPGQGTMPASELVLRELLPLSYEGLQDFGIDTAIADRLLGIIEQRCLTGRNGTEWQRLVVGRFEERGMTRLDALREMTAAYAERMHSNDPVHSWDLPA